MNVAVLVRSLANGGAEKQALLLAAALAGGYTGESHRVVLYVLANEPRHPPHLAFLERHGIDARFVSGSWLGRVRAVARALKEQSAEAVFCFLPGDTLLGAAAGRLAGVRRIYGGLRNTGLSRHKVLALRFLHNRVLDATVSNSRRAVEHFGARGFDTERLVVIPNGIELLPGPVSEQAQRDALTVLTVARFVDKKDPRTALEAIARLVRGADRPVRYLMVGYGSLEGAIRGWIDELGLREVVELLVDPPDVPALFAAADVYLGSSRHEGVSNSILEAMNHALPIVATDAGDTDTLVETGVNGRLVPVGDAEGLAEGLIELAGDAGLRARLGAASRRRLEAGHSMERFRAAYEELLRIGGGA